MATSKIDLDPIRDPVQSVGDGFWIGSVWFCANDFAPYGLSIEEEAEMFPTGLALRKNRRPAASMRQAPNLAELLICSAIVSAPWSVCYGQVTS